MLCALAKASVACICNCLCDHRGMETLSQVPCESYRTCHGDWLLVQIQKSNGVKYMPGVGPAVPQQCPETGANFLMGGPFWADPIHNMDWVNGILESVKV